jgi:DNA-directed RNA polymerase sigma subunit (sigma70/sigma32)
MNLKLTTFLNIVEQANMKPMLSADTIISTQNQQLNNKNTLLDCFLTTDSIDFSTSTSTNAWKIEFYQALNECLTPTEQRTLSLRYGLSDGTTRSVEHTAELMCLTPEGIRKIIIRAMNKLKKSSWSKMLEEGPPKVAPVATIDGKTIKKY